MLRGRPSTIRPAPRSFASCSSLAQVLRSLFSLSLVTVSAGWAVRYKASLKATPTVFEP